jgi:hypothetical protein
MKEVRRRKDAKKFDIAGKKIRNNKNPDGSKKKYIKKDKDKAKDFWKKL